MSDKLQPGLAIKDYTKWVQKNMNKHPIIPIVDNLNVVPKHKGIYFWFMHPDGYEALSKKLSNHLQPVQPFTALDNYHLVYIGTSGTGKDGNSSLRQRLEWHIAQKHSQSAVCSGALSTLRTGIGSLAADDLILYPDSSTETVVNNIFSGYFKVFWIEYQDDQDIQINSDEEVLISNLRPLFNLKNNPNMKDRNSPTYSYQIRRQLVIMDTKQRLNCNAGGKNDQNSRSRKKANDATIEFKGQLYVLSITGGRTSIKDEDGSLLSINMKDFLINVITDKKLPIEIVNSKNEKKTTFTLANDVIRHYGKKPKRNLVTPAKTPKSDSDFNPPNPICGKTLIIIPCSNGKKEGGNKEQNTDYFDVTPQNSIDNFRVTRKNILNEFARELKDPQYLLEAYQRYNGHIYRRINWQLVHQKADAGCLKIVIVSALFGLLEYKRKIPNYDFTFKKTKTLWGYSIQEAINQYIADNRIENVYSFLSDEYAQSMPEVKSFKRRPGRNQSYVGDWVNTVVQNVNC